MRPQVELSSVQDDNVVAPTIDEQEAPTLLPTESVDDHPASSSPPDLT